MGDLVYTLVCVWLGMAIMFGLVCCSENRERRRIMKIAKMACSTMERVLCYNATIIVDTKGQVCWFDNDKVKIIDPQ